MGQIDVLSWYWSLSADMQVRLLGFALAALCVCAALFLRLRGVR